MPEPRSKNHTAIEPHGYRKQMLPIQRVIAVLFDEVHGEECAVLTAELSDFAILEGCAIGAQFLVLVKIRSASAVFRQGEIDET